MKEVDEIVAELQHHFSCKLIGSVQEFGVIRPDGVMGSDVDFFVRLYEMSRVSKFLKEEGFVLEKKFSGIGVCARKFIDGKLYHLDIAAMPLQLHFMPDIKVTNEFYSEMWDNRDLEKFLRYITQFRSGQRYIKFVEEHFDLYGRYLYDTTYLNTVLFRKNVTVKTVVGVMKKKWHYYPQAFTAGRIARLCWAFLGIQIKKIFSTRGEVIAFVGADGAGKTTAMMKMASSIGTHHIYMGDSQFVLQNFYEKLFMLPKPIVYFAYPLMYVEQWLRYLWVWFKKSKGDIVLTDRWPGYNQNFFKTPKNRRLFKIMYTLFPKPDRFIFLHAPAETIIARKNELTSEQIHTMNERMRKALQKKEHIEVVTDDYTRSMNEILRYLVYGKTQEIDLDQVLVSCNPTVIDFTGIYASGKTTTAKALAQTLRDKGYSVKENDDMWDYLAGVPKIQRRIRLLSHPAFWSFLIDVFIAKNFSKNKNKDVVNIDNRKIAYHVTGPVRDLLDRRFFIKKNKNVDFIVFDEGSLYVTMDLLWKYSLPIKKVRLYASKIDYLVPTHFFYFRSNKDLSLVRTGERKSTSLIDNETDVVRKEAINELLPYHENIVSYAKDNLHAEELSPEDTVQTRVDQVLHKLKFT